MKFIISIFLLILCIIISQSVDYYLQQSVIEGIKNIDIDMSKFQDHTKSITSNIKKQAKRLTANPQTTLLIEPLLIEPTSTQPNPKFIEKYISDIKGYEGVNISEINTALAYAKNVEPINTKEDLSDYLAKLQTGLSGTTTSKIPQLVFFAISLPRAFKLFFFPDEKIPVPYNKLHANMTDIFPNSRPYTQIQIMCILWQQSMVLFTPSGPIINPNNDTFQAIIDSYITQIQDAIDELKTFYNSSYINQ